MRVAHGAHEKGLEGHQDRLGLVAVGIALLADRDQTEDEQTVEIGPSAQQPSEQESKDGEDQQTAIYVRGRVRVVVQEEQTQDPWQQPRTADQRYA